MFNEIRNQLHNLHHRGDNNNDTPPPIPPRPAFIDAQAQAAMSMKSAPQPHSRPSSSGPPGPSRFNGNPFVPIGTPISDVFQRKPHPLPFQHGSQCAVQTNKFYANLFLDQKTLPAFPHPYAVWWSKTPDLLGFAVSHCTESQRVFGNDPNDDPAQYYFNPAGIQSANLGACEFNQDNVTLSTDSYTPLSVSVTLALTSNNSSRIDIPLASGIGFITGIYRNLTPQIQSLVGFQSVEPAPCPINGIDKYTLRLFNGVSWVLYVSAANGHDQLPKFSLRDNNHLVANVRVGDIGIVVQVGSCPQGAENVYDDAAGAYAVSAELQGNIFNDGSKGMYKIQYHVQGRSRAGQKTLIYALPHHVESFTQATASTRTNILLDSTTMGKMTACVTDNLEMEEDLPNFIGFLPWAQNITNKSDANFEFGKYSSEDLDLLRRTAEQELEQDMKGQGCLDSMYFSGKGIDKFAFVLIVAKYILKDDALTQKGLTKLKDVFAVFSRNQQQNPLVYDTTFKGLISVAGYNDPNADFGNTYYNDHHFHYGYFFHAAAVIGQLDKEYGGNWINENRVYVNSLLRDTSNYGEDKEFPISRSFDWFVGHSWAKGLFLSGDGKDEESTSEDYHFAYGVKLWGLVSGDAAMESRGNLMIAIMRRAMNKYMLFEDDNCIQPKKVLKNKVSGITFENKIDHATYFGMNPEYVQGIHMIPVTPVSSYVRSPKFVKEEWDQIIQHIVDKVDSGWKGILMINLALFDPKASYRFFSTNFNPQWLDGGMSLTWCLAFAKGVC
ncbi:Dse4p [Sugiyamaella lignohabitans]|uniref:glucan endo-1,3-beta-D-glucosidase n=1 Tax=Sugiyamaella lignohabitans TaxID=796027 RepID=A0A167C8R2_9ASCO|nr:Dse4p [Sugiyamaella lignohabitans]ANB11364.1 Dse4p [Sugiyamaella lignohabitans]